MGVSTTDQAPSVEIDDPAMLRLVPADLAVERIAAGFSWAEGPVWIGDSLLCSDTIRNRIARWRESAGGPELTTFRYPSGLPLDRPARVKEPGSNGLTLDRRRRLIACDHGNRRLSRTEHDGTIVSIAEGWEGKRLNSPNDVTVRSDGTIYFTDPYFGLIPIREELQEIAFQGVYRIDPAGRLHLLTDDLEGPNGLALSPDERLLYVADVLRGTIHLYDVAADGSLSNDRTFAQMDTPDGMKVDSEGNVYFGTPDGIRVFSPAGTQLGRILFPERPANMAWGDADLRTLYVTATTCLYRLRTNVPGIAVG
jgi:gluconolactonase